VASVSSCNIPSHLTVTSAGMKAAVSFTLSVPDLDQLGFSTEDAAVAHVAVAD